MADAVLAEGRQLDPLLGHFLAQKLVGYLDQDSCAVGGLRIGPDRAPVRQVAQHGQTLLDDRVRLLALDMRHETDAASIVLMSRVVQALRAARDSLVHR